MVGPLLVTCRRCGHMWYTRSKSVYITCPNCMTKVRNPYVPEPPSLRERKKLSERALTEKPK